MRASIAEAIIHGAGPGIDYGTGEVKMAVYVDDFTRHLADCGFEVVSTEKIERLREAHDELSHELRESEALIAELRAAPVGEATEVDWDKIAGDIQNRLHTGDDQEWGDWDDLIPDARRIITDATRFVVTPLLAAPAGTPSGRWLCTTHNDTLDGPPGPFHDGPECRIVELLVPRDEGSDRATTDE